MSGWGFKAAVCLFLMEITEDFSIDFTLIRTTPLPLLHVLPVHLLTPSLLSPFLCLISLSVLPGRSSLFPFEDGFLDDGHGDPSLTPGLNSPTRCQNGERMERYSRKVFVGGLPPDIDEGGFYVSTELGESPATCMLCCSASRQSLCSQALLVTQTIVTGTTGWCTE